VWLPRYRSDYGLSAYDAAVLAGDSRATELFEGALASDARLPPKRVANWISGEYLRLAKTGGQDRVDGAQLAALVGMVERGELSGTSAKEVFARHFASGEDVAAIVAALGLRQINDAGALGEAIERALAANPAAVADVRAGKTQALGFLTGQVMKETRGQADAAAVRRMLEHRLSQAG
jgi:aspartyl-tRNA(Asn)/glutamyl-tRNA(Gln) amidotransferase subunit B